MPLQDFDTPFAMQSHLEEIHWRKGFDCVCRICEEGFKTKGAFIQHMTLQHLRSEMPYACSVCGFRSSFHKDVIDHFQDAHDRTDKLQCPRCLKTFSLFVNNQYQANVASSFVQHLQVRQRNIFWSCLTMPTILYYVRTCCAGSRRQEVIVQKVLSDLSLGQGGEVSRREGPRLVQQDST